MVLRGGVRQADLACPGPATVAPAWVCQARADVQLKESRMVLPPVKMFDASEPPAPAPAGYRAVAGYIGGDTPHVWTDAEWRRFARLHKLPTWVRATPTEGNAHA